MSAPSAGVARGKPLGQPLQAADVASAGADVFIGVFVTLGKQLSLSLFVSPLGGWGLLMALLGGAVPTPLAQAVA